MASPLQFGRICSLVGMDQGWESLSAAKSPATKLPDTNSTVRLIPSTSRDRRIRRRVALIQPFSFQATFGLRALSQLHAEGVD